MEISHPNQKDLTEEEQKQLEHFRSVVEKAIADSVLTTEEAHQIISVIQKDHKVTPQELEIIRTLIREPINLGKLIVDRTIDSL